MKAFLEEYGLVIVVIIVIAVLIALAVFFSSDGKKKIMGTYDNFTTGAQGIVEKSLEGAGAMADDFQKAPEGTGGSGTQTPTPTP